MKYRIFTAAFVLLCLIPSVGMLCWRKRPTISPITLPCGRRW